MLRNRDSLRNQEVKQNNMKSGTPKKAPKVPVPTKKKPFGYEKTKDAATERKSPQAPMKKKNLSK